MLAPLQAEVAYPFPRIYILAQFLEGIRRLDCLLSALRLK